MKPPLRIASGLLALFLILFSCEKKEIIVPTNTSVKANDFLSSNTYTSLTVQIISVSGFEPNPGSVANLKTFLEQRLNKPAGISVVQTTIASPGKTNFSLDDLKSIESTNRTQSVSGSKITAYFFFADADYSGNSGSSKVLGLAYGPSSMALFEKSVREFAGGVGQPSATTLETTVLHHELGHILGLVNNGTTMQSSHQDTANGRHCTTEDCLMYFNVETSNVIGNLAGGAIPSLDASCLADLKANGGR